MIRCVLHHDDPIKFLTVGRVIRTVDIDFECTLGHALVKNCLRIESTVIIAYTRMVTTNDQLSTASVLSKHCMQHCFSGPGVEHVKAIARHHDRIFREVVVNHCSDRVVAHIGGNIACLELTKEHVN